jgi:hypothetical protein
MAYGGRLSVDVSYATLRIGLNAAKLEVSPEKSKLFDFRQGDAMEDEGTTRLTHCKKNSTFQKSSEQA